MNQLDSAGRDVRTALRSLRRSPAHTLDTYEYSPKIREVWKQAGGQVRDGKRP